MKKNKDCLRILKNISYLCIMKPLAKDTRNLRRMIAIAALYGSSQKILPVQPE